MKRPEKITAVQRATRCLKSLQKRTLMEAGTETALARVVGVFGAAQPLCADLFSNRRATRIKVLVHDSLGIWLAARRLHQGKFFWPGSRHGAHVELGAEQLNALVLGLPWQRVGPGDAISIV